MAQLPILGAHPASAVQHQDDLLVAFILELPGNQLQPPGGCFPVNLADRVIRTIFPELMELPALTTARPRTDPQPGNLIVLGQQTKTGDRCKIRDRKSTRLNSSHVKI